MWDEVGGRWPLREERGVGIVHGERKGIGMTGERVG